MRHVHLTGTIKYIIQAIGEFKGGQGGQCLPQMWLLPTLVLADYTGNWEITNKVLSCNASKTFNWATFMRTMFGSPPLKFFLDPPMQMQCHHQTRQRHTVTIKLCEAIQTQWHTYCHYAGICRLYPVTHCHHTVMWYYTQCHCHHTIMYVGFYKVTLCHGKYKVSHCHHAYSNDIQSDTLQFSPYL